MVTILGAGGAIADELLGAITLRGKGESVRLVSRTALKRRGCEAVAADLTRPEDVQRAVEGSDLVYLVAGLEYNTSVWRESWPRIMQNVIDACTRQQCRLVFFDNVYMYGPVKGKMTEESPFCPTSKKGEVRAKIALSLLDQIKRGNLTAMIARAADFYGPGIRNSLLSELVLKKIAHKQRALWLVNDHVPHSFTYTPDCGRAMLLLADTESAWNQTWHLPTAPDPPTAAQFIEKSAEMLELPAKSFTLNRPMLKLAGLFDRQIREVYELLYQYDSPYLFDSTKFTNAFGPRYHTSYDVGLRACCAYLRAEVGL